MAIVFDGSVRTIEPEERSKSKTLEAVKVIPKMSEVKGLKPSSTVGGWEVEEVLRDLPEALDQGMDDLTERMCSFLRHRLSCSNCIRIFHLASSLEIEELWEAASNCVRDNFEQIFESGIDFGSLKFEELCFFVFFEELSVSEEKKFQAICKWIEWDLCRRRDDAAVLLLAVRFPSCSLRFLLEIQDHVLVVDQQSVRHSILKCIEDKGNSVAEDAQKQIKCHWNWFSKPEEVKLKDVKNDVLFVMGGCGSRTFETFSPSRLSWTLNKSSRAPSGTTVIVNVGRVIYAVEPYKERVSSFDPLLKTWKELQPLPVFRKGLCLASTTNGFYALGGDAHGDRSDLYDCKNNVWKQAHRLTTSRSYASATTFKGRIYCAGGGNCFQYFDSMEVYDQEMDVWKRAPPMIVQRAGHCLVSSDKYIWAVGGYNRTGFLNEVERFDSAFGFWSKMQPMPTRRNVLSCSIYGGFIFAIGGFDDKDHNRTEVYDPDKDCWSELTSVNESRICLGSCVVKDLDNAEEYTGRDGTERASKQGTKDKES